jgi:predicted metalloprotease with PDZ domain
MTKEFLFDDWVMVHEMVHLSFPPVKRRHYWLLEGLANYVEPIVHVRAGIMKEESAWRWLINGTPQGLSKAGGQGLDNTPSWGRKYWGGALFFVLADITIHKQTNNEFVIEHALRAIQAAGGSMQLENDWAVSRALAIGDKATGTKILMTLYEQMKDKPVMTDLAAIWRELGVSLIGTSIIYNDAAPLATIRRSIY